MPGALPVGDPAPASGELPASALRSLGASPFGIYVHVPFCAVRCGYCDFNTYTLRELGGDGAGISTYADAALAELDLAVQVLGSGAAGSVEPAGGAGGARALPPVSTVFVGGGTPTLMAASDLARVLGGIGSRFGIRPGAEVTTEANPDSVTAASLRELAAGGFTRVSLGMQSAVPHVLATLERTHDPEGVGRAVGWARAAGLDVSLDLIYGTPGESLTDWRRSLEAAVALEPDHVSAYALVVEEGTKLAGQVRRGMVPAPDDDDEADKYELADEVLSAAGYRWYEVSNWARGGGSDDRGSDDGTADKGRAGRAAEHDPRRFRCRHNEGYWSGGDWWGVGPGAHSHVGGVRWWNVRHPRAFAERLQGGLSPAAGRETLSSVQRYEEMVLLGIRRSDGLPVDDLTPSGRLELRALVEDGLVDGGGVDGGGVEGCGVEGCGVEERPAGMVRPRRVVLTRRGRLLADTVVRRLLGF